MKHTILTRTLLTTAMLMAGGLLLPVAPAYSESAEEARLRDLADSDLSHSKVRELLTQGTNPNVRGFMGLTAVHAAAKGCAKQNLEVILKHGGDATVRDTDGNTPLHHAVGGPALELTCAPSTRLLVQRGAPLNQANQDGNTALHLAAKGTRDDSLAVLLDAGANPQAINGDGLTPLQLFVKAGANEGRIVALLVDAGADPNRKTPEGYTPLHVTLKTGGSYGKTEVVEALLAGNADPCIQDPEGYIPYQYGVVQENAPLRDGLDRAGGGELTCEKQESRTAKRSSQESVEAGANPNMFLEMVGVTCEKAVLTVHPVHEVDDILECLKTQNKIIKEKWSELKASGKVITTPELRKKLDDLNKKNFKKHSDYANYKNSLPQYPSNDEWAVLKAKKVEWVNTLHDVNTEVIQLFNAEIIAQSKKTSSQTE